MKLKGARNMRLMHIRTPEDIRDWVQAQAQKNGRSQNTEVIFCLEEARMAREAREAQVVRA